MNDDNVQNALARLASDQEGSLPGLLGFRWTHARRGEISGRLEVWMRSYGLLETSTRLGRDDHEQAMDLYGALRDFPPPRTV